MKHISILVPNGASNLSSIVGAYKILTRANSLWKERHQETRYRIELVGLRERTELYDGLFSIQPHKLIQDVSNTNLIIIPSLSHQYEEALRDNKPVLSWIKTHYTNGSDVASICTGAFLLGATGLLNGQSCSTHWAFAHEFREHFPQVKLETDKLITQENGIYTNGGAYSFLNLILYLVERYFDREIAIHCSKVFQIEMDRHSQSPFILFYGQKKHDDDTIREVQTYLETHLNEKISMGDLSAKWAVGRRNFDRRFVKATGNTPVEYLQRVRIEAAKKMFEVSRKNISEVMYEVGYADVKAFREVFRKITGLSPLEYRKRYHKEAVT